jgi:hypothetical protein
MDEDAVGDSVDSLKLRFVGTDEDGTPIHELRASHVAEVLQGLVGIASDFSKAGAFGDGPGDEVLVRPAREGSFIIEVFRAAQDYALTNPEITAGVPSGLGSVIWWATRSMRAEVEDFEYLENGNVKVTWQDHVAQELPRAAWDELNKRTPRRRRQLAQIMSPLSDERVTSLEVTDPDPDAEPKAPTDPPATFVLEKPDYDAALPGDDTEETFHIFETEAQMATVNFDNASKWRVKTTDRGTRTATVEDREFLQRLDTGLAIRGSDIFQLRIREDIVKRDGRRPKRTWTVLEVKGYRRAAHDDDA